MLIINNKHFAITVYSIGLLARRFLSHKYMVDYHSFSNNMIIVNEVTKSEIKKAIDELIKTDFFDKLGCSDEISNNINNLNDKIKTTSLNDLDEEIEITYLNDSDEHYSEVYHNGYRDDVVVRVGQKVFNVNIMTIDRVLLDFGYEIRANNYYLTKPNLIIVRTMELSNIEKAIHGLYIEGFFKRSGPLDGKSNWRIFEYLHGKKK